jgi:pimeloyl-ACP methyl ester carboxylesterase
MHSKLRVIAALFALLFCGHSLQAQAKDAISPGRWKGSLTIKKNAAAANSNSDGSGALSSPITLRLLDQGLGGLLDISAQSMFGYPLDEVSWTSNRLRFSLDALGPGEELKFEGYLSSSGALAGSIVGTAVSASWKGSFALSREPVAEYPNRAFLRIPVEGGFLPGTLELPPTAGSGIPLVILMSGAGTTDRDGNNFNVPGKTDALALLASGLAQKGVASFRFDRRGAGEAYSIEKPGQQTGLYAHSGDAAKLIAYFSADARFSRIVLAGMNEGAWIGAMAVSLVEAGGFFADGLVVLDSAGTPPIETLTESLSTLDEATRLEARAIIKAILDHGDYPEPSEALSDFFTTGRREWLESWLKFDPPKIFAELQCPVLFVFGQKDMQVEPKSFERLLAARPGAPARIIPGMNYALKAVGSEEENFKSFTNPEFPVPKSLIELVAAFAKARPVPEGTLPYAQSALASDSAVGEGVTQR